MLFFWYFLSEILKAKLPRSPSGQAFDLRSHLISACRLDNSDLDLITGIASELGASDLQGITHRGPYSLPPGRILLLGLYVLSHDMNCNLQLDIGYEPSPGVG